MRRQRRPRRPVAAAGRNLRPGVVARELPWPRQQRRVPAHHVQRRHPARQPARAHDRVVVERKYRGTRRPQRGAAQIQHRLHRQQNRQAAGHQPATPPLAPVHRLVQCHHGQQHHGRFLGEHPHRRHRRKRRQVSPPSPPCRFRASPVEQQPAQHRRAGQQIRAPDNIGHRFRQHRMDGPQTRHRRRPPPVGEPQAHRVHQQRIPHVQQQVQPVVARRLLAIPQQRVVEQVRKRGQRPEQPAFTVRPPVSVSEDQAQVFRRSRMHPRILQDQPAIVHHEPAAERIRIHRQRRQAESQPHYRMAAGGPVARHRLLGFHETSDYQMCVSPPLLRPRSRQHFFIFR